MKISAEFESDLTQPKNPVKGNSVCSENLNNVHNYAQLLTAKWY